MTELGRVHLALQQPHFDFVMNLLCTMPLRYVDVAPIIQDIAQQRAAAALERDAPAAPAKPNGAAHPPEGAS